MKHEVLMWQTSPTKQFSLQLIWNQLLFMSLITVDHLKSSQSQSAPFLDTLVHDLVHINQKKP